MRHVRIIVLLALVAAVAIGFMLPNPGKRAKPELASQIPTVAIR